MSEYDPFYVRTVISDDGKYFNGDDLVKFFEWLVETPGLPPEMLLILAAIADRFQILNGR